jgi:hypothetical protein
MWIFCALWMPCSYVANDEEPLAIRTNSVPKTTHNMAQTLPSMDCFVSNDKFTMLHYEFTTKLLCVAAVVFLTLMVLAAAGAGSFGDSRRRSEVDDIALGPPSAELSPENLYYSLELQGTTCHEVCNDTGAACDNFNGSALFIGAQLDQTTRVYVRGLPTCQTGLSTAALIVCACR